MPAAAIQPAALITSEGKSIESLDLDRGTFLPLDAYNSEETEAIANETLGEKRRGLHRLWWRYRG